MRGIVAGQNLIQPILDAKCVACHDGSGGKAPAATPCAATHAGAAAAVHSAAHFNLRIMRSSVDRSGPAPGTAAQGRVQAPLLPKKANAARFNPL